MEAARVIPDTTFVLFGARGDLAWRLVVPALYNLWLDGHLPDRFSLLGVDRSADDADGLAERYRDGIAKHSRRGAPAAADWQRFAAMIHYLQGEATDAALYTELAPLLETLSPAQHDGAQRLFYLATPPSLFTPIARQLGEAGLTRTALKTRIVVEKPLGHDLESFRIINQALCSAFDEKQIYRIDHFLGKETVQNILALRFANPIFEPIWNRRYVDHVAISVAETLGVEHRATYYEHAGALRDMVQNHLMQLLCLVAMEAPVAYDADDIRGKKMDVLHALRTISPDAVPQVAARGQYGAGWINGIRVPAYREEAGIAAHSNAETYAALKLYVDNWRWQGVPFYLRTGKRLTADVSEISIRFQDVPHHAFPASVGLNAQPARLVIQIQPQQGIVLKFMAKEPGYHLQLRPVDMHFSYQEAFERQSPHAYETLLWDAIRCDATLFMRADQVEAAWRLLTPVLQVWQDNPAPDFPNYPAGSWGPEAAEGLIARDGRSWLTPTLPGKDAPRAG